MIMHSNNHGVHVHKHRLMSDLVNVFKLKKTNTKEKYYFMKDKFINHITREFDEQGYQYHKIIF